MSNKILMPQLTTMLAASTGTPKKQAEAFLKAYFSTISEALANHDTVRIKDFGVFKTSRVEARKSVNVSTGEEVRIPPHFKVVFTPAKKMADKVNKEFAWFEIMEINDTAEEAESEKKGIEAPVVIPEIAPDKESGEEKIREIATPEETILETSPETIPETVPENQETPEVETIPEITSIDRKEEEESERLGEKLEEDFGQIQPVEPFGPIDPDDPEPGEPESKLASPPLHLTEIPTTALTDSSAEEPVVASPEHVEEHISLAKDFDPYAIEVAPEAPEPQPEPFYITKDEFEGLATKSEFKIVVRNLKKVKASIDGIDDKVKKSNRKTFFWALFCCILLMVGGFFITYAILINKLSEKERVAAENIETDIQNDIEEEEYAYTTLKTLEAASNTEEATAQADQTKEQKAVQDESNATAPTSPSDVKAMDRITNTRYLTTMAKEHYGNYNLWPYIYLENEGRLGHPDRIKPGTTVVIPNIDKYNIDPSNPKDIEKAKKLGVEIYKKYAQNN